MDCVVSPRIRFKDSAAHTRAGPRWIEENENPDTISKPAIRRSVTTHTDGRTSSFLQLKSERDYL